MDTKDTRNTYDVDEIKCKPDFESIITIRNGAVRYVTGDYIYYPRTKFNGIGIKWLDDTKLIKKSAVSAG